MNTMTKSSAVPLPFIDLAAQQRRIGSAVNDGIARVLAHGQYIMGPEVAALESALATFCGAKHVVSCGNGTLALEMVLRALGVKPGDAILCPSFTFAATGEVVVLCGATPIFVDVHADTFNLDVASLEAALATAKQRGLNPAGVIPVDLFGQPADYDTIEPWCRANKLWMLSDAAQSFGAVYRQRKVGTIGVATATSFFPAKPLGCYGDGGAIFTDDDHVAGVLRSLRNHGQGTDRYDNVRVGTNGRLDTIQAAVLIEKLKIFPDEIAARDRIAARYSAQLGDVAATPAVMAGCSSVWAQYTIKVPAARRDALGDSLRAQGIPTAIYYPKPLHRQTAFRDCPVAGNGLPVSDRVAQEVISLPMHPYLAPDVQDRIVAAVHSALG